MMSKPLLAKTKQQFVAWFNQQDDSLKFRLMTTDFDSNHQLGRFRRSYIKALNDHNHMQLKGRL
jgi:poly(3-hydroxyalkanoate) synthetase